MVTATGVSPCTSNHPYNHHLRSHPPAARRAGAVAGDGVPAPVATASGDPCTTHISVDVEWASLVARATARVDELEALNADSGQRGRSWALPVDPHRQARTPVWSGRTQWQRQVRARLDTAAGAQLCRERHVAVQSVVALAASKAGFADSRTGRGVSASLDTLAARAGMSRATAKRARQVLAGLGMAEEMVRGRFLTASEREAAEAHHGGRQTRAASVWALISPRDVVMTTSRPAKIRRATRRRRRGLIVAAPAARCAPAPSAATGPGDAHPSAPPSTGNPESSSPGDISAPATEGTADHDLQFGVRDPLSLGSSFDLGSLFEENSPTRARPHAGDGEHPHRRNTARTGPHALSVHRCAAQLAQRIPGLSALGHMGALCNTLARSGIDTDRWSGHDIADRLDRDTRERGWVWPTEITAPLALLRWRLTRIDFTGPSPTEQHRHAADTARVAREQRAHAAAQRHAARATPTQRATHLADIRRRLAERTRTTPTERTIR